MQKAISNQTRRRALESVSQADWAAKTTAIGGPRLAQGIRENLDKYRSNFGPILAAANSVNLPARTLNAEENLMRRSLPVIKAMQAASERRKQGGG